MNSALVRGAAIAATFGSAALGFYAHAKSINRELHTSYSVALGTAVSADEQLDQALLKKSYGLIQDFDGLDAGMVQVDGELSHLRNFPEFIPPQAAEDLAATLDVARSAFEIKRTRIDRFKSQQARLHAVLLDFPSTAGDLAEKLRKTQPQLASDIDLITREMLFYTLSRDNHIGDRISAEINGLDADREAVTDKAIAEGLSDVIDQARLVVGTKPHLDGLTETILSKSEVASSLKVLDSEYQVQYQEALTHENTREVLLFLSIFVSAALFALWIILTIHEQRELIQMEHDRAEALLLNVLPAPIADLLKKHPNQIIAENYADVSVLFADIVGFTPLASKLSPVELVEFLNRVFSGFDRLAAKHGLEKIKTLGDAYMVAGGLPERRADHADAIANMALDMQQEILAFRKEAGEGFGMRIGINSGPVVAGVIGIKKFIYDLWGDAVNVASRMESHGVPNQIHCSSSTYEHLKDRGYVFEPRGVISVKGKGEMSTFLLVGREKSAEKQKTASG